MGRFFLRMIVFAVMLPAACSPPVIRQHVDQGWSIMPVTDSSRGLFIYTEQFDGSAGTPVTIEYEQRFDSWNQSASLAFLIGETWYISDAGFTSPWREWRKVIVQPGKMTYGIEENGPASPDNSGYELPKDARVNALGLFLPRASGKVRIANFRVTAHGAVTSLAPRISPDKSRGGRQRSFHR